MSGRSAHVRKEKTKVKEGGPVLSDKNSDNPPSLRDFPMPAGHGYQQELSFRTPELSTVRTQFSNGSEDMAYARVRKPVVQPIEVSGIEKSSFRSMMDKKSEGARKTLANAFGGRKKKKGAENEDRPATSINVRAHELDSGEYTTTATLVTSPTVGQSRLQTENHDFGLRSPPPTSSLPPIPNQPPVKQWSSGKKAPALWARLKKDPELWDDHGDVLIYLLHVGKIEAGSRPRPSFRLSSHLIEGLRIPSLNKMLANNIVGSDRISFATGEDSTNGFGLAYPVQPAGRHPPAPPMSVSDSDSYGAEISYELTFATPGSNAITQFEAYKYHLTVRNFFAMAVGASLVGMSFANALIELLEWMERTMPDIPDPSRMILNWLQQRELVDCRDNPSVAAGLLTFYESEGVRDVDGYLTAFCHCVGMLPRCQASAEWRHVPSYSRGMMENAHDALEARIDACQDRLQEFEFRNMWPVMTPPNPPSRQACERLRKFICNYYRERYGSWPPIPIGISDRWLTRRVTQQLQRDFGALWDYLVNRDVVWDGTEERSGRKWHMKWTGKPGFEADTPDLPLTDILVAFDNKNSWPHNPGPYPLTPESIQVDDEFSSRKTKPAVDKATERKYRLAYSGATNLYLLGDRCAENQFVEAFNRFEKTDMLGEVNPFVARRGRWVLIYGVVQTLASISVDVPDCRFTEDVSYYLGPSLKGCPPWRGVRRDFNEAHHTQSYCWRSKNTWKEEAPIATETKLTTYSLAPSTAPSFVMSTVPPSSSRSSAAMSSSSSDTDYTNSLRSPTMGFTSPKASRHTKRELKGMPMSYSGYSPGIEKLDEEGAQWPMREGSLSQFGSEIGDGSQHGSDYRREGNSTDTRRDARAQELRHEALANQRNQSRLQNNQDFRPANRAQSTSRQQNRQDFSHQESERTIRGNESPVKGQFRKQDSTEEYQPRESSSEFRRTEADQQFRDNNNGFRRVQQYDDNSDDYYDGIRDFDDYRL